MSGLEAVEIKLSELERTYRIDAEFYKKENLNVLSVLDKITHAPLTDYFTVSDGNHMSISHDFRDDGIRYYRGGDSHNFFIEESNPICISEKTYDLPTMKRSHLKKNDVLVSIVGTIGNISLVRTSAQQTCNCKLAILRPKYCYKAAITAMFLKSKYGQNQIQKFKRGAVQMGLLLEDMSQIVMPVFSDDFCKRIKQIVEHVYRSISQAANMYADAEKLLMSELNMDNFQPSTNQIAIKLLSESFGTIGRLDAEYYQPKYESYHNKIAACRYGITIVGDKFSMIKDAIKKTNESYPYIEIGDINIGNHSFSVNMVLTKDLPANAKLHAKHGDLLVSKVRPYRGAVSIVDRNIENLIVSGAFTVLREKSDYPRETLAVLLKTHLYRDWFLKWNVGSSYPVIKDEDVLAMPIPIFAESVHAVIKAKISESFNLRRLSEELLKTAKHAVEVAIENGEEEADLFLNKFNADKF